MAVQAALTGHLVLSTLHTNDAPTAVTRLLDLGVPPYLLQLDAARRDGAAAACARCVRIARSSGTLDDSAWEMIVSPWRASKPTDRILAAKGCLECRMTGYIGRIGIYEIMLMTPALRKADQRRDRPRYITRSAYREGMKPLRVGGAMKIAAGLTTVEEVMSVAPPAADRRQNR